jgi:hypothetical protein
MAPISIRILCEGAPISHSEPHKNACRILAVSNLANPSTDSECLFNYASSNVFKSKFGQVLGAVALLKDWVFGASKTGSSNLITSQVAMPFYLIEPNWA